MTPGVLDSALFGAPPSAGFLREAGRSPAGRFLVLPFTEAKLSSELLQRGAVNGHLPQTLPSGREDRISDGGNDERCARLVEPSGRFFVVDNVHLECRRLRPPAMSGFAPLSGEKADIGRQPHFVKPCPGTCCPRMICSTNFSASCSGSDLTAPGLEPNELKNAPVRSVSHGEDVLQPVLRQLGDAAHSTNVEAATLGAALTVLRTVARADNRQRGLMPHNSSSRDIPDAGLPSRTCRRSRASLSHLGRPGQSRPVEVIEAYRDLAASMENVEVRIFPEVLHGYMMRGSLSAFPRCATLFCIIL